MTRYTMTYNEALKHFNPQRRMLKETQEELRWRIFMYLNACEPDYIAEAFLTDMFNDVNEGERLTSCRNWAGRIVTDIAQADRMIAKVWAADEKVVKAYRENPGYLGWAMWDRGKVVRKAEAMGFTVEASEMTHNVLRVY